MCWTTVDCAYARLHCRPGCDAAAKENAELREFVERWKRAGAVLEADRWQRLCGATEVELNATAWDVLGLWQADLAGDDGEAIRIQQRLFARLAAREVR